MELLQGSGINATDATDDGGYIFAGSITSNSYHDIYINKIDSLGNLQWSKVYVKPNTDEVLDIKQNARGEYILCGSTNTNNNDYGCIIKTNLLGNVVWNRIFGRPGFDYVKQVEIVDSFNYLLTGATSNTFQSGWQFSLIKTDSLGNSGCNTDSVTFTTMDLNTIVDTLIFSTSSLDSFSISAFTITSYGGTDSILCFNNGSNAVHEMAALQKDVVVFPNPATGIINMVANGIIDFVKITNAMGVTVYSSNPKTEKTFVDLSHIARGIYFYSVQIGGKTERGKILLE